MDKVEPQMNGNDPLTIQRLRKIISYDPETGIFIWKEARSNVRINQQVGTFGVRGYLQVQIDKRRYFGHRLAWFYMTGAWPKDQIDHINLDKSDNRFENLREATASENMSNKFARPDNKSGLRGVIWMASRKKWKSQIKYNRQSKYLGYFDCPAAAHLAYQIEADVCFGAFARI